MTTRRGFLKSILALGMAPAIVKASSLMPIYTPKPNKFLLGDWTIEAWLYPSNEQWMNISTVRKYGEYSHYLDGALVNYEELKARELDLLQINSGLIEANLDGNKFKLIRPGFTGNIGDIKVIKGKAVIPNTSILYT